MYGIGRKFKRYFGNLSLSGTQRELSRINNQPRFKQGYARIFDKPFLYNDGKGFHATYQEIFRNNIYQFTPDPKSKLIIDCGANMGLSVLYFAIHYPEHQIIAFEPDPAIFLILQENVSMFQLKNVVIHNKAVWDKVETLTFFTDSGMGGRVENPYPDQNPIHVETIRLKDLLNEDVDFLKIDIEGAEDTVIRDCADKLGKVKNIFFEYHNDLNKRQTLHELLDIVKKQGFHYYIKDSYTRKRPFIDKELICEVFDMAINVFCYKNIR